LKEVDFAVKKKSFEGGRRVSRAGARGRETRWQAARGRAARGQAAIFDGITFLLMVGFSCALVYSVVTSYGDSMDNALNSFYELNAMQSVVKALYYVNVQQLLGVTAEGNPVYYEIEPALSDEDGGHSVDGCFSSFSEYSGSVTVLDLLKKDLSDYPSDPASEPALDDRLQGGGSGSVGVKAPGKQALRCALKELMKPFVLAGYDYYAEVVCVKCQGAPFSPIAFVKARASSNASLAEPEESSGGISETRIRAAMGGCAFVQSPQGGSYKTLSMSVPLRVSLGTACGTGATAVCQRDYILRVCVWQRR
jgi:hypothetical protein